MRKGNAPLLAKLKGLLETSSETSSITTIRELLFVWSDPRNVCRNGLIADFSPLISSCLGCNNNPLNLGAGASSISVAMYQIKYMGKETTEIALASSVLVDAQKSIRDHPSVAEDSGSLGRNAMHFMQRILNSAESEMEATRAASIVLGLASSGASAENSFMWFWDYVKLAVFKEPSGSESDSGDEFVRAMSQFEDDPEYDRADDNDSKADDNEHGPRGDNGNSSVSVSAAVVADVAPRIGNKDNDANGHTAAAQPVNADDHDPLYVAPAALEKDLIDQAGSRNGRSNLYIDEDGNKIAVSPAEHYAHRDDLLHHYNAHEFEQCFGVRKMNDSDKKWRDNIDINDDNTKRGAGRPSERFLFTPRHKLFNSHLIFRKAKLEVPTLAGAPPPRRPKEKDLHARNVAAWNRRASDHARCMLALFRPWTADSWSDDRQMDYSIDAWDAFVDDLKDAACMRGQIPQRLC